MCAELLSSGDAMTTDYRAICAELHTAIQLYTGQNPAAANVSPSELVCRLMDAMAASAAALAQPTPQPPADGEVAELQRWGVDHGAQPGRPLLSPMEDGYWTPWHIAADLLHRLASDNAELEAAAESLFWDNLSLLNSQDD